MGKIKALLFCAALLQVSISHSSGSDICKDRDLDSCDTLPALRQKLRSLSSLEQDERTGVYQKMHHAFKEAGALDKMQILWLHMAGEKNAKLEEFILDFFNVNKSELELASQGDVLNPSIMHALKTGSIHFHVLAKFMHAGRQRLDERMLYSKARLEAVLQPEVIREVARRTVTCSSMPPAYRLEALFSLNNFDAVVARYLRAIDKEDKVGVLLQEIDQCRADATSGIPECTRLYKAKRRLIELQEMFEGLIIPVQLTDLPNIYENNYENRKLGFIDRWNIHNVTSAAANGPLYALYYKLDDIAFYPALCAFDKASGYALWGFYLPKKLDNGYKHKSRTSLKVLGDFVYLHLVDKVYKIDRHSGKIVAETGFADLDASLMHCLEAGTVQMLVSKDRDHFKAFRKDRADQTVSLVTLDASLRLYQTRELPLIGYMNSFSSQGGYLIQKATGSRYFAIWYPDGTRHAVLYDTTGQQWPEKPVLCLHDGKLIFSRKLTDGVHSNVHRDGIACLDLKTKKQVWAYFLDLEPKDIQIEGEGVCVINRYDLADKKITSDIRDGARVEVGWKPPSLL